MDKFVVIFKALSDHNRLRIVAALIRYEELCACQIVELLEVTGATISRHLSVLVSAGLINSRKDGRWVYYHLETENPSLNPVLDWIKTEFKKDPDIKKDIKALKKIVACDQEDICRKQRGEKCCPKK